VRKQSKRFQEISKLVDSNKAYEPKEAISLVKKCASAKFDETVELHMKTGSDPKHSDQLIRGVALLPHGTGKKIRVLVFAQGEGAKAAFDAGAEYVADEEMIKKIESGWTEFEVSIATPDMMGKIGKLGKVLGRKGLMPNAKTGTVVQASDIGRAVQDAKKGRVEIKMDRTALIHISVGKASFNEQQLLDNMSTVVDQIVRNRPAAVKGQFIRNAFLTTTMGPSVKLDLNTTLELKSE